MASEQEDYLSWSAARAAEIVKRMQVDGRVGGWFDGRIVHTEHSYNYRLRATWLTPEVVRATSRLIQIDQALSEEETRTLVSEAESAGDTVILIEIDPQQGSGVIPRDWLALLQPKNAPDGTGNAVRGTNSPELRHIRSLAAVGRRDYSYDRFWLTFPLINDVGGGIFPESVQDAELVIRIYNKEGRVRWSIPNSIRERIKLRQRAATFETQ